MELSEYQTIFDLEDTHFWYVATHELVLRLLMDNEAVINGGYVMDAGCGTGGMLKRLDAHHFKAVGIDTAPVALDHCRKRHIKRMVRGSVCQLPFSGGSFFVITSIDVLYHSAVEDDEKALSEYYRVLRENGTLILHLPAYEFLRGTHDRVVHTERRYRKRQLQNKLKSAGFRIVKLSYRNCLLFPLVLMLRVVKRALPLEENSDSDLKRLPNFINRSLLAVMRLENFLLRKVSLPFGSSLYCVAVKPPRPDGD